MYLLKYSKWFQNDSYSISKFLGEKILPEEITPETAIAAEIKYGPTMILAHGINGVIKKYPIYL